MPEPSDQWLVRDAIPDRDAEACLAIYAPFVLNTAVSFEEVAPTVDELRDKMRAITATHAWLVAEIDGKVAGYAYGSTHRPRAAYRWTAEVTIYLGPDHRGKGLGRRLYKELLERLRRQGYHLACAGITLPNDASVGLHKAVGFQPVGTYHRMGWKLGAWHDVTWLELQLAPITDQAPAEPIHSGL
jgi:phosphinothricin acetyltransferase